MKGKRLSHTQQEQIQTTFNKGSFEGKPWVQSFQAIFDDKLFSKLGKSSRIKNDFTAHYRSIADTLFIPKPEIQFHSTYTAPDDPKIEITEATAIFLVHDISYPSIRALEDIFKSIAYYKQSVLYGYAHLDFRINVFESLRS